MQTNPVIIDVPSECSTLVDLLRWRSLHEPDKPAYLFLVDGEEEQASLTYGELDRKARSLAAILQSSGCAGERALLLYPSGLDYVVAFFACLYAQVVAVPAYPPRPARPNRTTSRVWGIIADAQPAVALCTTRVLPTVQTLFAERAGSLTPRAVTTDDLTDEMADRWSEPHISSDTLAFLQYTSGSTSTPKGVMVSHGNLLHNERLIKLAFRQTEQSVVVGWLPIYHDMGLIGNVLHPLYLGLRPVRPQNFSRAARPTRPEQLDDGLQRRRARPQRNDGAVRRRVRAMRLPARRVLTMLWPGGVNVDRDRRRARRRVRDPDSAGCTP
jgi:acyl-CoA synthetase (AMP-forming)/AMP-acid ligase II